MRNEKGVTLVELLAAISIFSLVLSVAFLLFSQVNILWNHSQDEFNYKSDVGLTTDTLSRELSEATDLYLASQQELRFKTFSGEYKTLVYDNVNKKLTLYQSNTMNLSTEPFTKDSQILSTDKVLGFTVEDYSPRGPIATVPQSLLNTKLYYLKITFEDPRVTANGGIQTPVDIVIKPFKK